MTAEQVVRVRTPRSTIQLRLMPTASGTTVAFHEDHLPDEETRTLRKEYWAALLDDLQQASSGD